MATDIENQVGTGARVGDAGRRPYRFTVDQFWRLLDSGIIPESHVELVRGRIYRMTKHEPHNFAVDQLADLLRSMVPEGFYVREEKSMSYDGPTILEPDVAVARGSRKEHRREIPSTSSAALLVEVCASTRTGDYRDKYRLYASAGVPVYWILDVDGRKIDVFSVPQGSGREAVFARHESYPEGSPAPVVVDGREVGRVDARDLLPPPAENPQKPPINPPA